MAKATSGSSDFSEVADTALTPEAQAALDSALGKAPAPVEAPAAPSPAPAASTENSTVANPSIPAVPAKASVPSVAKTVTINGLKVTNF